MRLLRVFKTYYPISFYLVLFAVVATIPASIATFLSVNNANNIERQAVLETQRRAKAELLKEVRRISDQVRGMAMELASRDETKALFHDATYYNYWKTNRVQKAEQYEGLIEAVDLYNAQGAALTNEVTLGKAIHSGAVSAPGFLKIDKHYALVYYQSISTGSLQNERILGYIGVLINMDLAASKLSGSEHSLIKQVSWNVADNDLVSIEQAVDAADLSIIALPEIKAFAEIIREGFSQYFIYATTLLLLLMLLLYLSLARPLS